ncbi:hypothetical protein VDGD_02102 [Verticillium dahliae]|nr:Meiotic coiled-coil protein 2 [Verticillium dahliae VDG1]RBQ91329.1 hypothetical protein VDGD_02102 [Verticillium dahliae]
MGSRLLRLLWNADIIAILQGSKPIVWFLTSYPAFVLTAHEEPGPRRWALLPFNIIGPLLCFNSVGTLAAGLDWLWAFTSLIYVFHVTSALYIECWAPASTKSAGWSLRACYKAWMSPRRLNIPTIPIARQSSRIGFVSRKLGLLFALWISYHFVEFVILLAINPRPNDFAPKSRSYVHLTADRGMMLRVIYAFHWAYLTYLILIVANALLAIVFVGALQLDEPEDWPPLYGSPLKAYSLRRFWGVFWHKIGSPSQAIWGRTIARRILGIEAGSSSEKMFVAFWVFAISGATHIAVNWVTKATAPVEDLMGDMVFLMLSFFGGLGEVCLTQLLFTKMQQRRESSRSFGLLAKGLGFFWVFAFFYFTVPPWQYPYLYADAKSRRSGFTINVDIPTRSARAA